MNVLLLLLTLIIGGGIVFLAPGYAPGALAVCAAVSVPTIFILARGGEERVFLMRIFILGVLIRLIVGTIIFRGHYEEFFGGDANTYHIFGESLVQAWHGDSYHYSRYNGFVMSGGSAWGMLWVVAAIYEVIGSNLLAVQFLNAAIGSATASVVYFAAQTLFNNERVSRLSAILVCFFPSLILWSSQALKDGLIVMALALAILATLRLMHKVTAGWVIVLTGCLLALLSLRFYIFYMMTASVAGSFLLGMKAMNAQSFVRRFVAIAAIGMAFTWFGVLQFAGTQLDRYANMQTVKITREDQARLAGSGFGGDVDVTTTEGALTAIPIGLLYLLFAPFPWQLASVRQSLALPEMLIWWVSFPLLVLGLVYALRNRLRQVAPIVLFTTLLTLAYSLFQGNVGTAYRQRSQLLVFYFIFVAVGAVMMKERSENRRMEQEMAKQQLAELQAARLRARRKSTTPPSAQQPEPTLLNQ